MAGRFVTTPMSVVLPALVIVVLLGVLWRSNWHWRFLGAWFFLILAATSSFQPTDSPAYEHRMYLPLAAVVVLGVLAIHALAGRRTVAVAAALAVGLGFLTWQRNQDYRSEFAIWADALAKRPGNPRAHNNVGKILLDGGRVQEAIEQFEQALQIRPAYAVAHDNLGSALARIGRLQEAAEQFDLALSI